MTRDKIDLYNAERGLTRALENLKNSTEFSEANKAAIAGFVEWNKLKGNSLARQLKYFYYCRTISKILGKDFAQSTKEDIKNLLLKVEDAKAEDGNSKYKGETKRDIRICLKLLYRFLTNTEEGYPEIVSWIKAGAKNNKQTPRSQILEPNDVEKLIATSQDLREKLTIALLFQTGARITELMSLRIKDIMLSNGRLLVTLVNFKTNGQTRVIPVGDAKTILIYEEFLKTHPERLNQEAPLFVTSKNLVKKHASIRNGLLRLAKTTGIDKPVNPHHFRHSRFTLWGEQGFTERELVYLGGWTSSDMVGRYVSSSFKLVQERFNKLYSGGTEDEMDKELVKEFSSIFNKIFASPIRVREFLEIVERAGVTRELQSIALKAQRYGKITATTFSLKKTMPLG